MKHNFLKTYVAILAGLAIVVSACDKYDDSDLVSRMDKAEADISALQAQVEQLNKNISSLTVLVDALNSQDRIVSVTELSDKSGYVIKFSKAGDITIYNGKNGLDGKDGTNGTDGKDGVTPTIGVKLDSDGNYYWTVNGEYLLDGSGNKISATAHVATPQIRINEGNFEISYNNGVTWEVIGTAGTTGDVVFSSVVDGTKSVVFTLKDGTTIEIPKVQEFAIVVDTDVVMSAGSTASVSYTITAADEGTVVDAFGTKGFDAEVNATSASAGTVTITAPDPLTKGKVYIIAVKSNGATAARILSCEEGVFTVDEIAFATKVPAAGGSFEVPFQTNLEDPIVMVDPAYQWIHYVETKAIRNGTIAFNVDENTSDEERSGVVIINFQRYTVVQEGKSSSTVSGGSADLSTINGGQAGSRFGTYSTTNGWTASLSRVLNYSSRFDDVDGVRPVLEARSNANGTLSSPILSGGCGTVTLDYTRAMTKTGSNLTLEIKDKNGNALKSVSHSDETLAQYSRNKLSFDVNVTGEFQIVVTGNKCSNTGATSDDFMIIALSWTGYSE